MICLHDLRARLCAEELPVGGDDVGDGLALRQVQGAGGHAEPQVAGAEDDQPQRPAAAAELLQVRVPPAAGGQVLRSGPPGGALDVRRRRRIPRT